MCSARTLLILLLAAIAINSVFSRAKSDVSWYNVPKFSTEKSPHLEDIAIESKHPEVQAPSAAKKEQLSQPPKPVKTITDIIDETSKSDNHDVIADKKESEIPSFHSLGCYNDDEEEAKKTPAKRPFPEMLANLRAKIDWNNFNKTIDECARFAVEKKSAVFGIRYYGECWGGDGGEKTYAVQGKSDRCTQGVGKGGGTFVYMFDNKVPVVPMKRPTVYCFPESSTVKLHGGHRVPMKDVKIGDRVKTLDARGYHAYSDVIAFLHRHEQETADYVSIELQNGRKIRASGKHLVFKGQNDSRKMEAVFASEIKTGDFMVAEGVLTTKGVTLSRVATVAMVTEMGVYAPLTRDGTMLVDGTLVSCYAHWGSHQVAHAILWPLRAWADITAAFHWVGSWVGFQNAQANQRARDLTQVDGIHWYAESLMNIVQTFTKLS